MKPYPFLLGLINSKSVIQNHRIQSVFLKTFISMVEKLVFRRKLKAIEIVPLEGNKNDMLEKIGRNFENRNFESSEDCCIIRENNLDIIIINNDRLIASAVAARIPKFSFTVLYRYTAHWLKLRTLTAY